MRLYFIMLVVFAACTFFFGRNNWVLAAAELAVIALLLVYTRYSARKRSEELLHYIEHVASDVDTAAKSTLSVTPLPVVAFSSDTGGIIWSNRRFLEITGERRHIFEISIREIVPEFTSEWLTEDAVRDPPVVELRGRMYAVFGSAFDAGGDSGGHDYLAIAYFVDVTDFEKARVEYELSRPIFLMILLDNYDELLRGLSEKDKSALLSDVDDRIGRWASGRDGYLCKYDRDRYFYIFEARHYDGLLRDKFSVLASVRELTGAAGMRASLSVGVGAGGSSPAEDYQLAADAAEMALSRGGDQAVIKKPEGFEFFGGHSTEVEKRTKVKTRAMASAFGRLLDDASSVYVMGHKNADMDSLGAAVGVCCIARAKGKRARIVIDEQRNMAGQIIKRVRESEDFKDIFIDARDAPAEVDPTGLLVVVDTSRPEEVELERLIAAFDRIVVIDHHRRAATYIDKAALNFYEPFASSASELVTELIQYLVGQGGVLKLEAEALLAGIVLDTKAFSIRTGSRTFDAAAYLRRMGADTVSVKRFMQSDFAAAMSRYEIIRGARMYRGTAAIAASPAAVSRVIIAQAADELLNIEGVQTSFVASPNDEGIFISGRSIGGVNVQLVLEKLGGGGNQSTAGAQVKGASLDEAVGLLRGAIDDYLENSGE
ncbi:MAG: DHH family phosphoesterase [Oscillospiraceae bacterium]|jgi:c-di-AMP phosphodiesterase-like protein|nr:DHH family phosphoesterase [Oscillospiraceae bacterium]